MPLTFDQTFETLVGVAVSLVVVTSAWIVSILLDIERTKVSSVLSSALADDDGLDDGNDDGNGGSGGNSLQLAVEIEMTGSSETTTTVSGGGVMEVEPTASRSPPSSPRGKGGAASPPPYTAASSPPRRFSPGRAMASHRGSSDVAGKDGKLSSGGRRGRRLPRSFVAVQCASVSALVLLTYLLLVVSNAPVVLRLVGSLAVFGVFLRYQIGDELRRQRMDRLFLLLALFLAVASMLSLAVYGAKTLSQGEIYEGPARIVGYDASQYNNTKHDPTTRTDVAVSWGKNWGCPLSGGKVCQSRIEGAMCNAHPDASKTKTKAAYEQELEQENSDLQKETAELEKEVDGTWGGRGTDGRGNAASRRRADFRRARVGSWPT